MRVIHRNLIKEQLARNLRENGLRDRGNEGICYLSNM